MEKSLSEILAQNIVVVKREGTLTFSTAKEGDDDDDDDKPTTMSHGRRIAVVKRHLAGGGSAASSTLFEGSVAIITGAGRGIGREAAILFAQNGARLVLNDLDR